MAEWTAQPKGTPFPYDYGKDEGLEHKGTLYPEPMVCCDCGWMSTPQENAKTAMGHFRAHIASVWGAAYVQAAEDAMVGKWLEMIEGNLVPPLTDQEAETLLSKATLAEKVKYPQIKATLPPIPPLTEEQAQAMLAQVAKIAETVKKPAKPKAEKKAVKGALPYGMWVDEASDWSGVGLIPEEVAQKVVEPLTTWKLPKWADIKWHEIDESKETW